MKLGINSPRFADFCFLTRLDFNEEDGGNNNGRHPKHKSKLGVNLLCKLGLSVFVWAVNFVPWGAARTTDLRCEENSLLPPFSIFPCIIIILFSS
jgi:hypothetical protein